MTLTITILQINNDNNIVSLNFYFVSSTWQGLHSNKNKNWKCKQIINDSITYGSFVYICIVQLINVFPVTI